MHETEEGKGTARARTPSRWDCFVSHASEDKEAIVRPLAEELKRRGLRVWYDEFELEVGDSLSEKIDEGLSESHHGIVILSQSFFEKDWSKKELAGLTATEDGRPNRILPVWHQITKQKVAAHSPTLADRKAATAIEAEPLADELISAMERRGDPAPFSGGANGLSLSPPPKEVTLSIVVGGRRILEQIAGRYEY